MAKHKCPECPAGEKWAVPYADFLSLLLALFIALWAISESNPAKVESLKTEFVKIFDFTTSQTVQQDTKSLEKFKGPSTTQSEEINSLKQLTLSQQKIINKLRFQLDETDNQIALNLPSKIYFERGDASINSEDNLNYIKRIAKILQKLPPEVNIEIRGFTDNSASNLKSFELSCARAQKVVEQLSNEGADMKKITIHGYAFNEPLVDDLSALENNRVEIYFKLDSRNEVLKKSVLELMGEDGE